ncbi:MAG: response regulator [Thermodesulfobacteriota bacterium]
MLIFIVEDEEGTRMLYESELADEGYEVIGVPDGWHLMDMIEKWSPDCVILDVRLRDHDGLDLLQDIKKNHPDLPVIMNTAYSSFRVDLRARNADAYIVKSSDLSELKGQLRLTSPPKGETSRSLLLRRVRCLSKLYLNCHQRGQFGESGSGHLSDDFASFRFATGSNLESILATGHCTLREVEDLFRDIHHNFVDKKDLVECIVRREWQCREVLRANVRRARKDYEAASARWKEALLSHEMPKAKQAAEVLDRAASRLAWAQTEVRALDYQLARECFSECFELLSYDTCLHLVSAALRNLEEESSR